ncbi:MAG: PIN domain-containing protein [Clostridia bacterium]|nr:MAG: PIN domain-containing protein [Clostridia bacterium]
MIGAKEVCVDASLLLKLVLNEPDSELADLLFSGWYEKGIRLIAPSFCPVEVDSVIRQKAVRPKGQGGLTEEQAELVFEAAQSIPLQIVAADSQRRRAWELAKKLGLPTVYDAHYLALAELRNCEFWTADTRFYNTAREKLPYVHHLQEIMDMVEAKREDENPV